MNTTEFIEYWADKNNVSKDEAKKSVECFIETFKSAAAENTKIDIRGFLSTEIIKRPAKEFRDPRNQKPIKVDGKKIIKLKISPKFKNILEE